MITASEFQRMVLALSNSCFVRHWFNYTGLDLWDERPKTLAFCCKEWDGSPSKVHEASLPPFEKETGEDGSVIYLFQRKPEVQP